MATATTVAEPTPSLSPSHAHAGPARPLEITNLTKRYGRTTVLDDLTFTVQPGRVTGFLGPTPRLRHSALCSDAGG